MSKKEFKEDRRHGSSSFPLEVYYNNRGFPSYFNENRIQDNYMFAHHWHEEVEFLYLVRGNALFQIDEDLIELHAGEAIFIKSGAMHAGYSLDNSYCEDHALVFDFKMLSGDDICQNKYIDPIILGKYNLPQVITWKSPWGEKVLKTLKDIFIRFNEKAFGYELFIKSDLYNILAEIISSDSLLKATKTRQKEKRIERLKPIINYIHQQYSNHIDIKELAAQANMSEYYFFRFFKSITGRTPVEYINYFRIDKAAKMLRNLDAKITDIAMEVGFNNFSYFIKIFKKFKGCTPSEFRVF